MLDFLRSEGIDEEIITKIMDLRSRYPADDLEKNRIPNPKFF